MKVRTQVFNFKFYCTQQVQCFPEKNHLCALFLLCSLISNSFFQVGIMFILIDKVGQMSHFASEPKTILVYVCHPSLIIQSTFFHSHIYWSVDSILHSHHSYCQFIESERLYTVPRQRFQTMNLNHCNASCAECQSATLILNGKK